ncbi:MT-A70 family methyltransferase [Rhizobium azibense]|nr:MT-A70 family methyltransferase [Rhizobium azibense]
MADPAWSFDNWSVAGEEKNAKAQYECMTTDEISALPVDHLAAGDCWIWLWATHPMLGDAFEVLRAWNAKFVTSGVWVKRGRDTEKKRGKLAFGTGYVLRCSSEPFLLAKIGDPPTFSKSIRTVIEAPRRQHSRKPEEAYKVAETLFGDVPRLDLFSRQSRAGWMNWGKQKTLFDAGDPVSLKREKTASEERELSPMPLFEPAA